jgi:predicted NBD/HSP70 family sugar kinase
MPDQLAESARQVLAALLTSTENRTKPLLSAATGLSRPTVGAAVTELHGAGIIQNEGLRNGQLGRAPSVWGLSPQAGWVLGIDVGMTQLRAVAQGLDGHEVETLTSAPLDVTEGDAQPPRRALQRMIRNVGRHHGPLRAVALALPDVVGDHRGLRTGVDVGGLPLTVSSAIGALGLPKDTALQVDNNVNCAALAELRLGSAQGHANVLYLQVGVGLGAGMISMGRLRRGSTGAAGELARLPFPFTADDSAGDPYGLETYLGAAGLMQRAHAAWADAADPPADTAELFARAAADDERATRLIADEGRVLARVIATIVAIDDPALVVLGGGIGSNPGILPFVSAELERLEIETPVLLGARGFRATAEGALVLATDTALRELLGEHHRPLVE